MASPRLETYCCPNRDAATQLVMNFQPEVFCGVCIGSASVSLLLTILQLLPKKGQSPRKMPKASSSSTILLLISICDILGGLGKCQLDVPHLCCSRLLLLWGTVAKWSWWVNNRDFWGKHAVCIHRKIWAKWDQKVVGLWGGKILFNSYILEVKAFDKSTPKSLLSNKLKSTALAGSQSKA